MKLAKPKQFKECPLCGELPLKGGCKCLSHELECPNGHRWNSWNEIIPEDVNTHAEPTVLPRLDPMVLEAERRIKGWRQKPRSERHEIIKRLHNEIAAVFEEVEPWIDEG